MADPVFRTSPSGREVPLPTAGVTSVFGRFLIVGAEAGDYNTDQVANASAQPGFTFSQALDSLGTSSGIANESSVPGATVTDALQTLAGSVPAYVPGVVHDSFSGGTSETVIDGTSINANVGDLGWNITSATTSTGQRVERIQGEAGAPGIYRITGPTLAVSTPSGFLLILGTPVEDEGVVLWEDIGEVTFRMRFDTRILSTSYSECGVGSGGNDGNGGLKHAAFFVSMSDSPFIQVINRVFGVPPFFEHTITTVLVDDFFHDCTIRRPDAVTIEYLIDGNLVATHAIIAVMPSGPMTPFAGVMAGGSGPQTPNFLDIDDYRFTPFPP